MNNIGNTIASKGLATFELSDTSLHQEITTKLKDKFRAITNKTLNNLDRFHEQIKESDLNHVRLALAAALNDKSFATDVIYQHLATLL